MEMKMANAIFAIEMTNAIDMVLELLIQQRGGGGGSKSNWEGMMKWWIPAHVDGGHGTYRPDFSDRTHNGRAAPPKWRGLAKKMFMTQKLPHEDYGIEERVYDIASNISVGHDLIKPLVFEELLDELQAYAEEVDVFQVLDSDRCLYPILRVLFNQHANLRAKAAELITTMVEMNPENAELVIEGSGLQLLVYNLMKDPDATSRTKALGAISAILRNIKPGIIVFRLANGYAALKGLLSSSKWVELQRDALNLIQYLVQENSSDCNIVTELGIPCIMMHLASSSDDAQVRKAALRVLLVLARTEEEGGNNGGHLVKTFDNPKQVLQKLIEGISAMAPEDLGSARDEIQLVDSLWNACYNEPSSLAKKGLLVLPGEDAPVPDVASKLFEQPPLRALAAAEADDGLISEKEDPLGLFPPSAATPTYQSNSSSKRRKLGCL